MTYDILIGDRSYSSWSLRGWLPFDVFGIDANVQLTRLYADDLQEDLKPFSPGRTVPAVRTPDGGIWTDTLAIVEGLTEAHPDLPLLPTDPTARALARSVIAEMHSGFGALRGACPMNLRHTWSDFSPSEAVLQDLARIELLWSTCRKHAVDGPWLFGAYTIADAFYSPVAARIAGYKLPVGDDAQAYVMAHLSHGSFRRWRAMGEATNRTLSEYDMGLPQDVWPVTSSMESNIAEGPSINTLCPYSQTEVTHFAKIGDRVFGFCNAFCRDKTVADPEAWPEFMAIYQV